MAEESNSVRRRPRDQNESCATPGAHRSAQSTGMLVSECTTKPDCVHLTQKWTVNEASFLLELSKPYSMFGNKIFKHTELPGTNWHLYIYPRGRNYSQCNVLSVSIHMFVRFPITTVTVRAESHLRLLGDNDETKYRSSYCGDFYWMQPNGGEWHSFHDISRQTVANCIRADGSMVMLCTVELLVGAKPKEIVQCSAPLIATSKVPRAYAENELAMLLDVENRWRCDLKITAGTADDRVVLWAHKFKLIAHSDVFYAMFHHNTKERETNSVMIEDFAAPAVKNMLIFVYVGSISLQGLETKDIADVMRLADKYFIKTLKALCEKELIARICSSNVVDFVELADFGNAICLYENCVHFMSNNRHSTLSSLSWQALADRNTRLAASITDRMYDLPL